VSGGRAPTSPAPAPVDGSRASGGGRSGARAAVSVALDAHAFLTRLPLPGSRRRGALSGTDLGDAARFARASTLFPLVGVTVGGLAALALLAGSPLGRPFAAVLALAVAAALTGALHEDALADVADGLGPHDRARRLEVMRDPRIGAFGALAIVLSVAARLALLIRLPAGDAALALVGAHVLARWAPLPLAAAIAPARGSGAGALLRPGWGQVGAAALVAAALAGAPLAALSPAAAPAAAGAALVVAALAGLGWLRVFGGVTGDTHGATVQLVEIAVYAAAVAAA
jgi:adenosylcobinamide-GDP ribazoletransferase